MLSVPDLEKINEINQCIKRRITNEGQAYVHGFTLKSLQHQCYPLIMQSTFFALSMETLTRRWSMYEAYGKAALDEEGYAILSGTSRLQDISVFPKLRHALSDFFGQTHHVALIYGSSTGTTNS